MARSRKIADAGSGPALDPVFAALTAANKAKFGEHEVYTGDQAEALMLGVPIPFLCLRYLFQSTVIPLRRLFILLGFEGMGKSAMMMEFARWYMMAGGYAYYIGTEEKDPSGLRRGLFYNQLDLMSRLLIARACSLEEWQEKMTFFTQNCMKTMDAKGGPGRTFPVFIGLDSVASASPEAEIEDIETKGSESMRFSRLAKLLTGYDRAIFKQTAGFPFAFFYVNHLKDKPNSMGLPEKYAPGGRQIVFRATIVLEFKKLPRKNIELADYGGQRIELSTAQKNSMGPGNKDIAVELLWTKTTGEDGRYVAWDWHRANIECLIDVAAKPGMARLIHSVVDLQTKTVGKQTCVWSRALGIPEDSPMNFRDAGWLLEQRQDLMPALHSALGVEAHHAYTAGVDYAKRVSELMTFEAQRTAAIAKQRREQPAANAPVFVPQGAGFSEAQSA